MAVLIDPPAWPAHGRLWSHLVSDTSFEELHAFAARAGVPGRGFEGDHYDVPEDSYAALVDAGALPVAGRELLRRLRASGLRRPKRRGEKVLASTTGPAGQGAGTERVDAILSTVPPLLPVRARHVAVLAGWGPGGPGPWLLTGPGTSSDLRLPAAVDAPDGPVQIGYLRHVLLDVAPGGPGAGPGSGPERSAGTSWAEVVLRQTVDDVRSHFARGGVRWLPLDAAVRGLAPGVAALVDEVARTRRYG